jgi:hypothetical protein
VRRQLERQRDQVQHGGALVAQQLREARQQRVQRPALGQPLEHPRQLQEHERVPRGVEVHQDGAEAPARARAGSARRLRRASVTTSFTAGAAWKKRRRLWLCVMARATRRTRTCAVM